MWTYDLPAGYWAEGEYRYYFQWAYTMPREGGSRMDPLVMIGVSSLESGETLKNV